MIFRPWSGKFQTFFLTLYPSLTKQKQETEQKEDEQENVFFCLAGEDENPAKSADRAGAGIHVQYSPFSI